MALSVKMGNKCVGNLRGHTWRTKEDNNLLEESLYRGDISELNSVYTDGSSMDEPIDLCCSL